MVAAAKPRKIDRLRYAVTDYPVGRQIFASDAPHGIDIAHSYKAVRQPNGKFTIRGLDIFQACQRKNPGTGEVDDFSREWMEAAVARFNELRTDGHFTPAHLEHHSKDGTSKPLAGLVSKMWVADNAKGIPTLYADVSNIPPGIFAELADLRIPYRSVEINNPKNPEISSLAFMATQVPYFKFPITNVQLEGGESSAFSADSSRRVCFAETVESIVAVQRFDAESKPLTEPTRIRQRFMGMGMGMNPMQYADEDEDDDYGDDDDYAAMGMGGEIGGDEAGMTEDDIIAVLQEYLSQQQPEADGGGMDAGYGGGIDPDEQAELSAMGETDMGAVVQGIQQLLTQNQELVTAMKSLAAGQGDTSTNVVSPPPAHSAEPRTNGQQFADAPANGNGNGNGAVTFNGQQYVTLARFEGLLADFSAYKQETGQNFAELADVVADLKLRDATDDLSAAVGGRLDHLAAASTAKGYSPQAVKAAINIAAKSIDADLEKWQGAYFSEQPIDPQAVIERVDIHFAEVIGGMTPANGTAAKHAPPLAPTNGAKPMSEAGTPQAASVQKFLEEKADMVPFHDADPQGFLAAFSTAEREYDSDPSKQKMIKNKPDYVANRVKQAFGG